eukprot:967459-Amphidinium_carterae.1
MQRMGDVSQAKWLVDNVNGNIPVQPFFSLHHMREMAEYHDNQKHNEQNDWNIYLITTSQES